MFFVKKSFLNHGADSLRLHCVSIEFSVQVIDGHFCLWFTTTASSLTVAEVATATCTA